jgi:hypothetical protein
MTAAADDGVRARARDLADILRTGAPALVQTFGGEAALGPIWAAAAHEGRPLLHFVRAARAEARGRQRWGLIGALRQRASSSRHVTGLVGSSRAALARAIETGLFPAATFARVIAPPIELPATVTPSREPSPLVTFGVYDPYAGDDDLRFVLQAIASSGHTDLFNIRLAVPTYRLPPILPRNVSAADPGDPAAFVGSVDALVVPYDADHLLAGLAAALQAGKTVIVPDGGLASELIGFGRTGVLFVAGSAYDLALKINVVTGSSSSQPFAFHGGQDTVRACAPGEVAKAFAASFRFALTTAAGA